MQLSEIFLNSIKDVRGFDRESFEETHRAKDSVTSIRINPAKIKFSETSFPLTEKIPWTQWGFYLPQRPSFTFDPLFHGGLYYVQEASSMFLETAFSQLVDTNTQLKVLDLCAAPGGKSTHLLSLISEKSLLVSNEAIRSRVNSLQENIVKWGNDNVVITNNDAKDFQAFKNYFDVVVVDAPCSGSGLFRRDELAMEEWSLKNVALCSQRQQRIIADILPSLKENGVLIYSTCSYSFEEDEAISKWLVNSMKMDCEQLQIDESWGIIPTEGGYRFWPNRLRGEGFFLGCFRKKSRQEGTRVEDKVKLKKIIPVIRNKINNWAHTASYDFFEFQNNMHAVRKELVEDINRLWCQLQVVNFGINVGVQIREKYIPSHALAMSHLLHDDVPSIELDYHQAIQFLKKQTVDKVSSKTGFHLATFKGCRLGWFNMLSNRMNNYYPKELRIRKQ